MFTSPIIIICFFSLQALCIFFFCFIFNFFAKFIKLFAAQLHFLSLFFSHYCCLLFFILFYIPATFQKSTFIWRSQIFWLSTLTSSSSSSLFLFFFFASRRNCYELSIGRHLHKLTHIHLHRNMFVLLSLVSSGAASN